MILPAHDASVWDSSLGFAVDAVGRGEAIILPTDTVYGIGCDAFNPEAVAAILAAKGRGRESPPPVLVHSAAAAAELATELPHTATALMGVFWPGPLTLVVSARPGLDWNLGESQGTVAVRVPDHPTALALLARTGPLAVTSANLTGSAPATTAEEAERSLGAFCAVVLDAGPSTLGKASTILDVTGPRARLLRVGAIDRERIEAVVGPGVLAEGAAA